MSIASLARRALKPQFLLPLFALPAAMGGALYLAHDGASREIAQLLRGASPVAGQEALAYVSVNRDIDIPLPGNHGRLRADIIAVVTERDAERLASRFGPDLRPVSRTTIEAALLLAEALEADGQLSDGLNPLRAALPEAMRDTINAELAREGMEPAILEVLIDTWAVAPP